MPVPNRVVGSGGACVPIRWNGTCGTDAWIRAVAGDAWTVRPQPARVESFRFVAPHSNQKVPEPQRRVGPRTETASTEKRPPRSHGHKSEPGDNK